jgi:hypothetical protein
MLLERRPSLVPVPVPLLPPREDASTRSRRKETTLFRPTAVGGATVGRGERRRKGEERA